MNAAGACLQLLDQLLIQHKRSLDEATLFVADVGPGSFTGVKVGVVLAKMLANLGNVMAAGVSSFDLIAPEQTAVVPSKRGEYWIRRPGAQPELANSLPEGPFCGYGDGVSNVIFPDAGKAAALNEAWQEVSPERLAVRYLAEPSISTPKTPYRPLPTP